MPHDPAARAGRPGHPLHVPRRQGAGRIDSPADYLVLYLSDAAAGAVAEALGNLALWTAEAFAVPGAGGARRAVATYELGDPARVLDLDDPAALTERGLRPSDVVSRDRQRTQAWARSIWAERRWAGLRWWSYHDPRWHSYGLWDVGALRLRGVEALSLEHPAVVEAAAVLRRRITR